MYAIYGNMDPINTPNVRIYTSTMDPMGYVFRSFYDTGTGEIMVESGKGPNIGCLVWFPTQITKYFFRQGGAPQAEDEFVYICLY